MKLLANTKVHGSLLLMAVALLGACSSSRAPNRPVGIPDRDAKSARATDTDRSSTTSADASVPRLLELAASVIGAPYRYAGTTPRGFDCSGLTHWVFERAGLTLPRSAQQQSAVGHWVAIDEVEPGDLVFFGDSRDALHHVGLVVSAPGEGLRMIHASSSKGVVATDVTASAYWVSRLRFARRPFVD